MVISDLGTTRAPMSGSNVEAELIGFQGSYLLPTGVGLHAGHNP